jgi:hypothetical protein
MSAPLLEADSEFRLLNDLLVHVLNMYRRLMNG